MTRILDKLPSLYIQESIPENPEFVIDLGNTQLIFDVKKMISFAVEVYLAHQQD